MTLQNCEFANSTHLIIKADGSADIADFITKDNRKYVLLVTGMGSVQKIGVYDKVVAALKKNGIAIHELTGIRANPEIETVIKGINICRKNKIDAILPLGGGSVYDSAKAIAAGACLPPEQPSSDVWKFFENTAAVQKALPIYGVLTLSATGSEMNGGTVIQDDVQKKKWHVLSPHLFPVVSIVDPNLQKHLPWYQQVNGFVDAIMHILEHATNVDDSESVETTFQIDIALIKSIIKSGNILQKDNEDYDARANFIWAATCALNGFASMGMHGMCGGTHMLEHPMGAVNPKISHGAGLGVAFPAFVRANAEKGLRLKTYDRIAREVFGKQGWDGLIEGWVGMLKQWGHPTTLRELFGEVDDALKAELVSVCKLKPFSGYWPDMCIPEDIIKRSYDLM